MSQRGFHRIPGGLCWLGLHLVWRAKFRRGVLGARVAARGGEVVENIAGEHGEIVAKEVMADHVLRAEFAYLRCFAKVLWSASYFAASVGDVSQSTVRGCIEHRWEAVG